MRIPSDSLRRWILPAAKSQAIIAAISQRQTNGGGFRSNYGKVLFVDSRVTLPLRVERLWMISTFGLIPPSTRDVADAPSDSLDGPGVRALWAMHHLRVWLALIPRP